MREILFRGKDQNEKWIYGCYTGTAFDYYYIAVPMAENDGWAMMPVSLNTVGQFTGLTDKNDNKIFEGDIIKNEYEENEYQYFKVFYNEKKLQWEIMNKYGMRGILANVIGKMEVIGNIFDNPNLL